MVEKYTSMPFLPVKMPWLGFPLLNTSESLQGISIEEAEEKLLTILKQVMEEKLTATNIEVYMKWLTFNVHSHIRSIVFSFADGVCVGG